MFNFFTTSFFTFRGLDLISGFILYFTAFCFIGWFIEMLYLSTAGRGLISAGFLQGPFAPAYAFGVLLIYPFTLLTVAMPFWIQMIFFVFLATAAEYVAHIALEKILGIRIWDYTDEPFNFQGRICLKYSIFWLFLVAFLVYVLQPATISFIQALSPRLRYILTISALVIISVDYAYSMYLFGKFSATIRKVCQLFNLPEAELHDLQFNRPRIMNEKKRVAKLMAQPDYKKLDDLVEEKLLTRELLYSDPEYLEAIKDILEHPKFVEWTNFKPKTDYVYRKHLRIAELSWLFCGMMGLNKKAAARGALLSAYKRTRLSPSGHARNILFPQETVMQWVWADFGKPPAMELDIILHYKWPINFRAPISREGLLVSFADKLVGCKEFRHVFAQLYTERIKVLTAKEAQIED